MAKRIEEQGVTWVLRDGSPQRIELTKRFGAAPTVLPISDRKPIVALDTIHILEQHRDHFVVSVKHPLGGYDNFRWLAEGIAPDYRITVWKFLAWGAGVLVAMIGVYGTLVELKALPNIFASG